MTTLFWRRIETLGRALAEAGLEFNCQAYIPTPAGPMLPETGDEKDVRFSFTGLTRGLHSETLDRAEDSEESIAALAAWFKLQVTAETMRRGPIVWQREA